MTNRENFARILRRDRPDHVMIDFGGCPLSRIDPACQASLLDYLGYPHGEPDRTPGSKNVDERLLRHFGIEVRSVGGMMKPVHSLYRKISDTEFIDHWGIRKRFTGMYWDIVQPPLQGASLEDLEKYPWPDGDDLDAGLLEQYAREAKDLRESTDFVLCAEHPVYGIFEMGCWMCGFSDFLTKMALEPEFVQRFFEIFLGYQKKVIRAYYGALGPYLDYTSSGDDFATQNGPFFSPDMFDELVAPYFSERISYTKRFTSAAFLHHSCGSVISLIPSLIRCGVEMLNPLQPRARDMDPAVLKRKFGGTITFHGGFDTQQTLLEKDPAKIEQEVARLMDTLGRDGGYVFAAAHNLQADVPPQNIVTMLEAAKKYGKIS